MSDGATMSAPGGGLHQRLLDQDLGVSSFST
jgi:hypothetical protein